MRYLSYFIQWINNNSGTLLILLGFIFLMATIHFLNTDANVRRQQCAVRFGQEWEYRDGGYGPDLCVNGNGEAKVL